MSALFGFISGIIGLVPRGSGRAPIDIGKLRDEEKSKVAEATSGAFVGMIKSDDVFIYEPKDFSGFHFQIGKLGATEVDLARDNMHRASLHDMGNTERPKKLWIDGCLAAATYKAKGGRGLFAVRLRNELYNKDLVIDPAGEYYPYLVFSKHKMTRNSYMISRSGDKEWLKEVEKAEFGAVVELLKRIGVYEGLSSEKKQCVYPHGYCSAKNQQDAVLCRQDLDILLAPGTINLQLTDKDFTKKKTDLIGKLSFFK